MIYRSLITGKHSFVFDSYRQPELRCSLPAHMNIYQRAVLRHVSEQRFLNQNALRFNILQGVVDIQSAIDILTERLQRYHTQVNMRVVVKLIFISAILQTGVSLTCYSCYSLVNWTHCDEQQQKYICAPWLDVCAKSRASFDYRGIKFDVYERGCFKGDYCNTMACKFISKAENCDMQCCDYDFCNDADLPTNGKILVGCLVLFTLFNYVLYR